MNLFLSTPLFEKAINGTPLIVDIHYARGWSFFPTRIHAKGLSIRGTDSHVEWILRFDEIEFDCSLLTLARQQFHVTRARGTGITFRARLKVEAPAATAELVDNLPPIDSLGPVGFVPSEPGSPAEWNDALWHLWTVRIDDAVAEHVREVWIEGGRFDGDARITGGFLLKPMRAAYVGPAHIDVRSGAVALDARTVAEPLVASVDFELSEFDPRFSADTDLYPRISLSVDAAAVIPDIGNLGMSPLDSEHVQGTLEVPRLALRIAKGVIRDGTHIDARTEKVSVRSKGHDVSGAVDLTADVAGGTLAIQASLARVVAYSALRIPRATLVADSKELDLLDPFGDLHGVLDIPDAGLSHAAGLTDALPQSAPLRIDRGSLSGSAHLEAWRKEDRIRGNLALRASDLELTAGQFLVRPGASAEIVASADVVLDGERGLGTVDARAPGFGLEYAGRRIALDLSARARAHTVDGQGNSFSLDEASLVAKHLVVRDAASAPSISVEHVSLAATSPRLVLKDPLARLEIVVAIDGGRMISASALGDLLPAGSLAPASKQGASFDGDLSLKIVGHVARGAGSLSAHGIGVAGAKIRIAGDARAVADIARWDFRRGTLGGSVALTIKNATGGFDARSGPPDFAVDQVDARVSAEELDLAAPSMSGVDYALRVGHAELGDARALNAFLPSPAILAVESGHAILSADISTSPPQRQASGSIDVLLADGGVRLHKTRLSGDFGVAVHLHGFDLETESADLEGSRVQIRSLRVTGASTDTSAWSGDFVLQSGTLRLEPHPKLEGDLTLEARDASPLLAILFRDSLPSLVAGLTKMPSFTAVTHVAIEPESLVVSDLFASGGDLALRGTYALRGEDRDAAFVVQKGPLSVGVSLDNTGSGLRLFGLDSWYVEHSRAALVTPR
ncbi:MAG: hypothetical protein ACLQVI_14860 [Polyangiaceae bacterium]